MSIADVLAIFDFNGFMADWAPATIAIVLSVSFVFLILAIAVCFVAFQTARSASVSRHATENVLAQIYDLAHESRQLAARTEEASLRVAEFAEIEGLSDRMNSVRLGDRAEPNTEYSDAVDAQEAVHKFADDEQNSEAIQNDADAILANDDPNAGARLQTAARAASEPSALLRTIMRRR
ncbi:MAG: hypothetical protein HKP25_15855 [Marinicaulis sp.]|nr:hypothetical protein [Marinicaulis sp.]